MPLTLSQESQAALFVAADNTYLSTADQLVLRERSTGFTVAGWVRFTSLATDQTFLSKQKTTASTGWYLQYQSGANAIYFAIQNAGQIGTSFGFVPATNTWYFVVGTYDPTSVGAELTIEVNQNAAFTGNGPGALTELPGTTGPFTVGADDTGSNRLGGRVCLVGKWSRVLTAAEKTGLYNGGKGCLYAQLPAGGIKTSLVAWWNLAEKSGVRADSVGSANLAETAGTVSWSTGPYDAVSIVADRVVNGGRSAQFVNAKGQYVSIASNATLMPGNVDFSFVGWVYLDTKGTATTDRRPILAKWDGGANREYLLQHNNSTDRFDFFVSADGSATASAVANTFGAPSVGAWYFVAGVHDSVGDFIKISVNGGAFDSTAFTHLNYKGTNVFAIGARVAEVFRHDGRVDRVGYWSGKALSLTEIQTLYNSGRGLTYADLSDTQKTSLVSWWDLDEVAGIRYDSHGTNDLAEPSGIPVSWNMPVYGAATPSLQRGNRGVGPLNGTSQSLSIASNSTLQTGDIDFTYAGWCKFDRFAGSDVLVAKNANAPNFETAFQVSTLSTDKAVLSFQVSSNGTLTTSFVSTDTIPRGQWAFVAAWHDSVNNTLNIQINNGTVNSTAYSSGVFAGTGAFLIGNKPSAGAWSAGTMDAWAFWKKVLSAAERKALYANGAGLRYADLAGVTSGSLLTSLSGWWELDEYTGSRLDSSGNANTLAENGGPIFASGGSFQGYRAVPATGDRAARFDQAKSQYLTLTDNAALSMGTQAQGPNQQFSVAAWVYAELPPNGVDRGIVGKWNGGVSKEYLLAHASASGKFTLYYSSDGATTSTVTDTTTVSTGTWYFVVGTYDGANIKIRVNNGTGVSAALTTGTWDGAAPVVVGGFQVSSSGIGFLAGRVTKAGIWKKALSDAEQTELYASGLGLRYQEIASTSTLLTSLAAYWNLDEAGGSRACCVSAANALTENGGSIGWARGVSGAISPALGTGDRAALLRNTTAQANYLSRAETSFIQHGNFDFTWAGWVKFDVTSGVLGSVVGIMGKTGNAPNAEFYTYISNSTFTLTASSNGTALTSLSSGVVATPGLWYFVVVYHDSVNDKIGISINSAAAVESAFSSSGVFDGNGDLFLGCIQPFGWTGPSVAVDKWGRWNKKLSTTEIASLYNTGIGLRYAQLSGSLTTSLQAYWDLDETNGSRADATGNGNTLTETGSVGWTMPVWGGRVPGKLNGDRSAQFNGNGQSLSIVSNTSLQTGDIDFSIAGWFYLDGANLIQTFVGKWALTLREYILRYNGTNLQLLVSNDGSAVGVTLSRSVALQTNTWYFVVAYHDSVNNLVGISLNNDTATTSGYASGLTALTAAVRLGADTESAGRDLRGRLDKFGFWKKVLSTTERTTLYNNGVGLRYANIPAGSSLLTSLSAWWDLDELSGVRFDAYGNNHLTDNGLVTWHHAVDGSA